MRKVRAILLGAGARGALAYAPYARKYPHELEIAAVAEPWRERREAFAAEHSIPAEYVFADWEEVFRKPKFADAVIICTQDRMHFAPTMRALELGYDVLLEKPMSPDPAECLRMERAAAHYGRKLTICHVLRYTPFWSELHATIASGAIGDVVSLQLSENVGYFHIAHSFVRGKWRSSEQSSPMILAKSCHDTDLIAWLVGEECVRVSSYGSLFHFREGNAPEGAPLRCTDGCPHEAKCAFSASRFYLGEGKDWALHFTDATDNGSILQALREGPYGRCVYRCDNDVVDHQVVAMEFANGATAVFSMSGFTHDCSRHVHIMGTKGEIRGCMEERKFTIYDFATQRQNEVRVHATEEGHGGGDEALIRSFIRELAGDPDVSSLTAAQISVQSHLIAFAAERSRLQNGEAVALSGMREEFKALLQADLRQGT
ncbi:Inositol 2-dehydrogenase/D-chiro-inositol 3-dehydrogenase [Paenibacillus sp. CECT 9249]|uniref:Gfo/Idh/MocA family protein n=1 Tax=Paenibacillus sp. CECT 9249 TaxID=2845385 RepID=UPI001E376586|nr:Gfo/Idh/MocA family oxidoreductase [Paenibacillus sp. CECT 9249]CAH0119207.1 Inositol 2-dehydrogenase/D-chiro-inositol 3-dehydrogenase [Paenibacillus sp. CECT 9249]